ncbi:MAG: hypothetical protein Q8Q03_00205 [bacterium]|nr:hypothetical protein [bacterium]
MKPTPISGKAGTDPSHTQREEVLKFLYKEIESLKEKDPAKYLALIKELSQLVKELNTDLKNLQT